MKQAEEEDMSLKAIHFQNWRAQTFSTPYRFSVVEPTVTNFHHHTIFLNGGEKNCNIDQILVSIG